MMNVTLNMKQRFGMLSRIGSLVLAGFISMAGLTGCGENKYIAQTKKAVLQYDKSRTIETAMKARCSSMEWAYFTSKDGMNVVEVYGIWKDETMKKQYKKLSSYGTDLAENFRERKLMPGDYIHLQFVIMVDGSISLQYGEFLKPDKKTKKADTASAPLLGGITLEILLRTLYEGA